MNINYNKVSKLNSFHGVVLKGNETFDELLEIEQDRKKRVKYLTEDQLDTIEARALKETKQDNKENKGG